MVVMCFAHNKFASRSKVIVLFSNEQLQQISARNVSQRCFH